MGLATRAISFALDAAVINLAALLAALAASLILSVLHLPSKLNEVLAGIGAAAYVLGTIGYFVLFWSTVGQTPGARVMRIRVITTDQTKLRPRRALVRFAGVLLGAIPLFAGYLLVLFDGRRRAFADRLARTLVIDAPQIDGDEPVTRFG